MKPLFHACALVSVGALVVACSASDDSYQNPNRATNGTMPDPSANPAPTGTNTAPAPTGTNTAPAPTGTNTAPAPTDTASNPPPPVPSAGQLLTPTPTGWVDAGSNTLGIQGPWYSYNDCKDSPADCTTAHLPPEGEFTNVGGKMCTSGTTAKVNADTEFSTKWGAGIALDLNNSGGIAAVKAPYNALSKGVKGFSFTLTGTAPGLRVNFPTPSTATASHFTQPTPGPNTVLFSQAQQGSWVTSRSTLDESQILAIQFQIPSTMTGPVAFDFCIENLTALTQ